eukprot:COSAG05_NODE_438_length_9828_cov_4.712201_6_plen_103_part_00
MRGAIQATALLLQVWHRAASTGASAPPRRQQTCAVATERLTLASDALRDHFWNESTGLWGQNLWWHQANSLEIMASHAILDPENETLRERVEQDIGVMYRLR